jgi:hypothetical protein
LGNIAAVSSSPTTLTAATWIELILNGNSATVPISMFVAAVPSATITVISTAASIMATITRGYQNRETAAYYGNQQRKQDQTNELYHSFFLS